jgi:hypothetical protein
MRKARDGNQEGEVVLIHYQNKPMAYARIEAIEPDLKKDWYQVTLLFLTIPPQTVTWILREAYIDGEPFTMGGKPVKLDKVEKLKTEDRKQNTGEEGQTIEKRQPTAKTVKVIPFKREK